MESVSVLAMESVSVLAIGREYEVVYRGKRRGVYQNRETAQDAADALARALAADARIMEGR